MAKNMLLSTLVTVGLALAFTATPSSAATGYCSPSGDVCTSAAKTDGVRFIEMRTFSFRGRVRVCVGAAWGFDCKPFRLRLIAPDLEVWSFRVRWRRHFPDEGPGVYRVSFDHAGTKIGRTLSFRR